MKKSPSKNKSEQKNKESAGKKSKDNTGSSEKNLEQSAEEFPGYPHYSTTEDIYNQDIKELELNEEGVTQTEQKSPQKSVFDEVPEKDEEEKSETDVTPEDLKILDDNLNSDLGEDNDLRFRDNPVDMTAEDLDVPGVELDDEDEAIGEEDEENNPYSIGGDRHEDLEENHS